MAISSPVTNLTPSSSTLATNKTNNATPSPAASENVISQLGTFLRLPSFGLSGNNAQSQQDAATGAKSIFGTLLQGPGTAPYQTVFGNGDGSSEKTTPSTTSNTVNTGATGNVGTTGTGGTSTPYLSLLQNQLQQVLGLQNPGTANINSAADTALNKQATQDTATKQNLQLSYLTNNNSISNNARNAYTTLMSLLGHNGAGSSSAALYDAPNAIGQAAAGQKASNNTNFNGNMNLEATNNTNANDTINTQKQNQLASFLGGLNTTADNLQQEISYGGGNAAPTDTQSLLDSLMASYTSPTFSAGATPNFASYSATPTSIASTGNTTTGTTPTATDLTPKTTSNNLLS